MRAPPPRRRGDHSLGSDLPGDKGARRFTQRQHRFVVHPHDLPVQGLLGLRQNFPLLVGKIDGHLIKQGRHLGQSRPLRTHRHVRVTHTSLSPGEALTLGTRCPPTHGHQRQNRTRAQVPEPLRGQLAERQHLEEKPPSPIPRWATLPHTRES